jgi:DNA-binding response OmpR family regulator
MRVLVIEDDEELAHTIATGLRDASIAVDIALDGHAGLTHALQNDYEVIVLDRDLPILHGDHVCAQLTAAGGRSRVLMLTAATEDQDLIDGLGLGADDYLTKPFAFAVLLARTTALARRAQPTIPPTLHHHDLVLDTAKRTAHRAGKPLTLRPKEFGVLELLLAAQGRVVPAEELLQRVWDEAADPFTSTVKVTISRLRTKLGDPPIIHTIAKAGYRI